MYFTSSFFFKRAKQLSVLVFLLLFATAAKAQSPVTLSYSSIDQTAANTIQGHLNSGVSVIVTSTGAITIGTGVTILKSAGADATLTFKANYRVTMNVNTSIKSTAGKLNLIFWSNATNDSGTKGMIRFGDHLQPVANVIIESNGGHLWMGGGNTNTSWNGLTVGNGYAWGSALPSGNGWYGIELFGDCRFFTSGGNISLNGRSTDQTSGQGNTYAMYLIRSIVNAGSGNIDINTLTDGNSPAAGETTGIGIVGDGGFTTTTGNITINNTIAVQGNTSGSATGIYLDRSNDGNPVITSNQGNVSIVNNLSGAAAPTKWYIDINEINFNREKSLAGASFTELVPDIFDGGSSTFTSSNTGTATVNNSGLVTPVGIGVTNITGLFARSDWSSNNSRWRYKLEVRSEADPILSFSQAEVYKNVNDASFTFTATQLNQSGTVGAITYTSSNRSVATVDVNTGAVTIVGEGSAVIKATSARTVTYVQEGNATYTLYVVNGLVVFTSAVNSSNAVVLAYGNVVSDGGNAVTERGFVYSLTSNPTTSNTKVISGSGTGTFFESISGLLPSTIYYIRAYVINSLGTSYGSELSFTTKALSQATTVNVAGTSSTLTITNAVQTAVDPALTVSADGNLTDFTVTITGSYTAGDVLAYTGTLPSGITAAAFNATTRSLVFSGTTTAANWQTLLRTVTIQTVSATCFQEQRQVSFVVGNTYYNNMNGHFYENVPEPIEWATALANAATKSYFGRAGYLATMTSLSETNFLWKIMASDSWMGASDDFNYINAATGTTTYANQAASEGNWYWITGPEKGTLFSIGNDTPATQSGQFAYWYVDEPNDSGGEHYGQFYFDSNGNWNDLPSTSTMPYIVEYGGISTDNTSSNVVFTRNLYLAGAPSGTITGGNTTVCSGTNTTSLTLTGLEAGGTVVKWQSSYDDFLTAGTDIPNTSTTLTVNNITQNTYYRAVVNTTNCTELTSSSTRIYVSKAIAGNIVADNNSICANANVNFILNGYSGTVSKWQVSTSSTFASGITDIANTTTALSYQLTSAGTYYFRAALTNCSTTVYTAAYAISCVAIPQPLTITNSLCAANGLDWVTWSNVTTTTATGTMNGVGVTVTQSNPGLGTTPEMWGHANFPVQYNVPNGTTINNFKAGTFTINFAKPINNPQVAFSSIGAPGITVGITTSVAYSVIWAGVSMTYPTATTMTGTEGFTIISFPGLHSSITMTYDTDENYANIAFGAENTNCSDPIICQGTPITLTASGGSTYLWSPSTGLSATNTASVIATPTVTTTYSVIDTSNACAVASTVTVTVASQAPILNNAVTGTQYYTSNSAITPIVITNSGGAVTTGGYSVAPALPTGLILGSDGTISGTPTVTSASTIYTITGTNGCGNSTTTVTIATGIAATISNFNNVNKMYHDGSYSIVAPISNSTGAFSYTSSNPAVATISGTTVTIHGAGSSIITANQAANASFNSASVTATLTVSSVSVLTNTGAISSTNLNYINQYGQIGGNLGLSANGAILNAKTPPALLAIGDSYGGGIVAYILVSGDSGYDANVQHGIIAAVADQGIGSWGCWGTQISGADGIVLGTGNQNTIDIELGCTSAGTAADLCANYTNADNGTGVYNDWYLPSKDELAKLYALKLLGYGNFNSSNYWSSTEYQGYSFGVGDYAWNQDFSNGNQIEGNDKTNSFDVRAIRAF